MFTAPGVRIDGFLVPTGATASGALVLGVRPEDLRIVGAAGAAISGEVFAFELTGDATFVTLKLGDAMCSAKGGKHDRHAIGSAVGLALDAARCHLFDAQSGLRIEAAS